MIRRSLLHFTCAILLIVAQQGALTHFVWHLNHHTPGHAYDELSSRSHSPQPNDRKPQPTLCDLHFAMGSLLAGDCAGTSLAAAAQPSSLFTVPSAVWRANHNLLTPPSRAPPVLL